MFSKARVPKSITTRQKISRALKGLKRTKRVPLSRADKAAFLITGGKSRLSNAGRGAVIGAGVGGLVGGVGLRYSKDESNEFIPISKSLPPAVRGGLEAAILGSLSGAAMWAVPPPIVKGKIPKSKRKK